MVTDQHVPPRPTITVEQSLAYEALGDGGEGGGEVVEEYNYYDTPEYIRVSLYQRFLSKMGGCLCIFLI